MTLLTTILLATLAASAPAALATCTTHWDVVSSITSSASWTSLQFDIGYADATGRFAGTNGGVLCNNLASGAIYAASDLDTAAPLVLRQGWIATTARPAPSALSRCTFLADGNVDPSSFTVTLAQGTPAGTTIGLAVTCSLCGNGVVDAGEACDPAIAGQECCNAETCSGIVAGCNLCGNGIVNAGEQCDNHENVAGDCCSSTCRFDSAGTACGDATVTECSLADGCDGAGACSPNDRPDGTSCGGDLCHDPSTCAGGVCPDVGPPRCDDANPCTHDQCDPSSGACSFVAQPETGCRTASTSSLLLSTAHGGKAVWKWSRGPATVCDELGSPDVDTAYDVCIYDGLGNGSYALASDFHVPAGAAWQSDVRGDDCTWSYKDKTAAEDGVRRLVVASGTDAATAALSAIGSRTSVPPPAAADRLLHFGAPAIVQMFDDLGVCWESTFATATKNSADKFRASTDTR